MGISAFFANLSKKEPGFLNSEFSRIFSGQITEARERHEPTRYFIEEIGTCWNITERDHPFSSNLSQFGIFFPFLAILSLFSTFTGFLGYLVGGYLVSHKKTSFCQKAPFLSLRHGKRMRYRIRAQRKGMFSPPVKFGLRFFGKSAQHYSRLPEGDDPTTPTLWDYTFVPEFISGKEGEFSLINLGLTFPFLVAKMVAKRVAQMVAFPVASKVQFSLVHILGFLLFFDAFHWKTAYSAFKRENPALENKNSAI